MVHKFVAIIVLISALSFLPRKAEAQTIEILAGNTLNGAVNGTLLGGAVMGLTDDSDFAPLRVGLGLGTLYGIGVGAYDVTSSGGSDLLVSGMFNDGNNTSIIVLLDTFYGAAAGAVVVTSIMLVANEPLVDGLQYGSSIGAWAGFTFGLFDAFLLSERITPASVSINTVSNTASGLMAINFDEKKSIGFLSPSLTPAYQMTGKNINREIKPTLSLVNLKVNF